MFTTRLGEVATLDNLAEHFKALLNELGLRVGADGKSRTLYSFRHYYATRDLKRGMSTHELSRQMGNSTAMLDKHYSKYSPLLNADKHSGRNMRKAVEEVAKAEELGLVEVAFGAFAQGKLDEAELLAALRVGRAGYVVTEDIAMKAVAAKGEGLIGSETLLKILNG